MRFILLTLTLAPLISFGQVPLDKEGSLRYRNQVMGGFDLTTRGLGGYIFYAWQKNSTYKHLVSFDLHFIRHPKQTKSNSFVTLDRSKPYYYGKLISLFAIRPSFGGKKLLFKKKRAKGVEISWRWNLGPSIGMQKPVYLYIINGAFQETKERYDPEKHNIGNIKGRAPWGSGLNEVKAAFGLFGRTGFIFDFGVKKDKIFALEVGGMFDAYYPGVQIMANNNAEYFLPVFYVNLSFGKKFF